MNSAPIKPLISTPDLNKIDVRIGTILAVEDVGAFGDARMCACRFWQRRALHSRQQEKVAACREPRAAKGGGRGFEGRVPQNGPQAMSAVSLTVGKRTLRLRATRFSNDPKATPAIAGATTAQSSRVCRAPAGTYDGGWNRVVGRLSLHCWKL